MRNSLISMVANFLFWWTKQNLFLVINLEPGLFSRLQPRKKNCAPTELDVSISAPIWVFVSRLRRDLLAHFLRTSFDIKLTNSVSWQYRKITWNVYTRGSSLHLRKRLIDKLHFVKLLYSVSLNFLYHYSPEVQWCPVVRAYFSDEIYGV